MEFFFQKKKVCGIYNCTQLPIIQEILNWSSSDSLVVMMSDDILYNISCLIFEPHLCLLLSCHLPISKQKRKPIK